MNRTKATDLWIAGLTDGWVDLRELKAPEELIGECGMSACDEPARAVDPSGVGWCARHLDCGMHRIPSGLRSVYRTAVAKAAADA